MDYDVVAFAIPPITVENTFESLLNNPQYIDFLMDVLDVMPSKKKLIIFDITNMKKAKGQMDEEKKKSAVVNYFVDYSEQLKKFRNPLTLLYYIDEVSKTILSFAEHLKRCLPSSDIALFNTPDPATYYNEHKDYISYAVGRGVHKLHIRNIFEYQPVGPLYGTNDLLGEIVL